MRLSRGRAQNLLGIHLVLRRNASNVGGGRAEARKACTPFGEPRGVPPGRRQERKSSLGDASMFGKHDDAASRIELNMLVSQAHASTYCLIDLSCGESGTV